MNAMHKKDKDFIINYNPFDFIFNSSTANAKKQHKDTDGVQMFHNRHS